MSSPECVSGYLKEAISCFPPPQERLPFHQRPWFPSSTAGQGCFHGHLGSYLFTSCRSARMLAMDAEFCGRCFTFPRFHTNRRVKSISAARRWCA